MSLLTDRDIQQLSLVRLPGAGSAPTSEPTACNLTLGEFVEPDPKSILEQAARHILRKAKGGNGYRLKPQEMVWAVSKEVIVLPEDITGYLHMKTGLATKGIMSITTGMIDPTWTGPVSVLLVNFSEREVYLEKGDEFLRVTFHQHGKPSKNKFAGTRDDLSSVFLRYVEERRREVRVLPETFLNLKGHSEEIADASRERLFLTLVQIATIAAVIFSLAAITIPIGVDLARSKLSQQPDNDLSGEVRVLEQRIGRLEQAAQTSPDNEGGRAP